MIYPKPEPVADMAPGPASAWHREAILVGLLAVSVALFQLSAWGRTFRTLPATARFWISMLPVHVVGLGAILWVCRLRTPRGRRAAALRLEAPGLGRRLWLLAPAVPALYLAVAALTAAAAFLLARVGYTPRGTQLLRLLRDGAAGGWPFEFSVVTGVLVLAPFAEEVLFRGVLFEGLRRELGTPGAAMASALLFAVCHAIPEQVPGLFVLGVFLQFLRLRTGSLWPAIWVHAGFNACGLGALFWLAS
ncbi:MAG: CPBP family intramembrane metalloprotease [Kiritimatiellaeota bacterium]|nr:CPBP family intramembrane metalloprotease [Kiritimatiellota bacterium]